MGLTAMDGTTVDIQAKVAGVIEEEIKPQRGRLRPLVAPRG